MVHTTGVYHVPGSCRVSVCIVLAGAMSTPRHPPPRELGAISFRFPAPTPGLPKSDLQYRPTDRPTFQKSRPLFKPAPTGRTRLPDPARLGAMVSLTTVVLLCAGLVAASAQAPAPAAACTRNGGISAGPAGMTDTRWHWGAAEPSPPYCSARSRQQMSRSGLRRPDLIRSSPLCLRNTALPCWSQVARLLSSACDRLWCPRLISDPAVAGTDCLWEADANYNGTVVTAGADNNQTTALACCESCKEAATGEEPCNSWTWWVFVAQPVVAAATLRCEPWALSPLFAGAATRMGAAHSREAAPLMMPL